MTIRDAGRIVVLDQGCIVEVGPHETLLRSDGLYARLHAMQTGADAICHSRRGAPSTGP